MFVKSLNVRSNRDNLATGSRGAKFWAEPLGIQAPCCVGLKANEVASYLVADRCVVWSNPDLEYHDPLDCHERSLSVVGL